MDIRPFHDIMKLKIIMNEAHAGDSGSVGSVESLHGNRPLGKLVWNQEIECGQKTNQG
jgi:hypothetical protein